MAILSYIIWNGSPEIFRIGAVTLRWYGLFFALGFLITQQILYYIYKKEGKPEKDVDTLTIYMVIGTIIGARLGHVLFYEPERFLANPIDILKIWEGGLASHGAAITIPFVIWLYSRKKKPGQNYLQLLDRIVILVALTSALIRFGNFFNSEIIGTPTDKPWGVVFVNRLSEAATNKEVDTDQIVDYVSYVKNDKDTTAITRARTQGDVVGRKPLLIYLFFKPEANVEQIDFYMNEKFKDLVTNNFPEFFDEYPQLRLQYQIAKEENGGYAVKFSTLGIARHPAQLYESATFVLLFIVLFLIWARYKENLPEGRLLGVFLIVCFSLRFAYEFLKENQVAFENDLPLNLGQLLSIPLIIIGIVVLFISFKTKSNKNIN